MTAQYERDKLKCTQRINDEVIVRLPVFMNIEAMQKTIDLLSLKEATARSVATQREIDLLADEANKGWWEKIVIVT